jgi:hypothetical protein
MIVSCIYLEGGFYVCPSDSASYWGLSVGGVSTLDGERGKGITFTRVSAIEVPISN